jgi:hypothetical protein
MSSKFRGTVIKVPDHSPGLLMVGGVQKAFVLEGVWQAAQAPAPNQTVEVELDAAGAVVAISLVDTSQQAREALQEHGKQAAELARQGVGALAARLGKLTLAALVVLWVAWFFLPALGVGPRSFTFWQLLSLDQQAGPVPGEHGPFSFLGLLAIAAPFAVPFIRKSWARFLNLAPLGFLLLTVYRVWSQLREVEKQVSAVAGDPLSAMGAEMARSMMQEAVGLISYGWGAYVLGGAAIVLGALAFRAQGRPVREATRETGEGAPSPAATAVNAGVAWLLAHKAVVAVALVVVAGAAWLLGRSDLSSGSLEKAINRSLEKQNGVCWALKNNDVKFPFQVSMWEEPHTHPILGELIRGGFITAQRARAGFGGAAYAIDLTAKGRSAGVWDSKRGFCVGRSRVAEVLRWTEPVGNVVRVNFTWKLETPAWVDGANFPSIPGMKASVEAVAVAQKTSDGWQVPNL